jgi:hypothetical protein
MNTYRKNATIVGILYILGTVFGILSAIFTQPVANAQDYFAVVTSNENRVIIGAFFILMMGLVLAMAPVVLFPILKRSMKSWHSAMGFFEGRLRPLPIWGRPPAGCCWCHLRKDMQKPRTPLLFKTWQLHYSKLGVGLISFESSFSAWAL